MSIKVKIGEVEVEMDKELVSKAVESGELTIDSDELIVLKKTDEHVVYTKEEHETFKKNHGNEEHKSGRLKSAEMLMKAIKEKAGIEYEGKVVKNGTDNVDFEKTAETFISNLTPEIEKKVGIEPNKKLQETQDDLKAVKESYSTLEIEFNQYKEDVSRKETRSKKDNTILSAMPSEGLIVGKDIALIALKNKSGLDVDFSEEGKTLTTINGEVQKDDKLKEPEELKNVIVTELQSLNLIKKANGGAGEEDDTGESSSNYEKFVKEMKANGIEEGSQDFNQEMHKRISDKTLTI